MSKFHLLVDKFIDGSISQEERKILERWIKGDESNMAFFKGRLKESNPRMSPDFDADAGYQRFLGTLSSKKKTAKAFPTALKYAAVLVLSLALGFWAKQQLLDQAPEPSIKLVEQVEGKDTGDGIVIKLGDGTTKVLSAEGDEAVTDAAGNIVAQKGGSSIAFDPGTASAEKSSTFNEVFIPFGQTFKLALSDGTQIWLNAGSKLRFPQRFAPSDGQRMVYLDGEAFFDVAKNKDKPFIVNTNKVDVKVLGTRFNVSSYSGDGHITTTLVEGSVNVYEASTPKNVMELAPGFQATYDRSGSRFTRSKVDTDIYTAWMRGHLIIDNLKFPEILVKLERRYFVKFENKARNLDNEIYTGEFVEGDIESVLETMALSTPFNYEIKQNIITITP